MSDRESISIWFFIGVSLLVNGILIAAAGAWPFQMPPAIGIDTPLDPRLVRQQHHVRNAAS